MRSWATTAAIYTTRKWRTSTLMWRSCKNTLAAPEIAPAHLAGDLLPLRPCADTCFFYLANRRDPTQVPSYKIQSTLGEIVKTERQRRPTSTCATAWTWPGPSAPAATAAAPSAPMASIWASCSATSGACVISQGFVPWELKIGSGMHRIYRAQMDVTSEDWVETCEWMADEQQDEWPGLEIPVDKEDADIMYTVQRPGAQALPGGYRRGRHSLPYRRGELDGAQQGLGTDSAWRCSPGTGSACKMHGRGVYEAIERLRPKRVMGTECGHAHRATVIEGPYWVGRQGRPAAGAVPALHRVGGRGPAHRQDQDRPGQTHQGAGHPAGLLQLRAQLRLNRHHPGDHELPGGAGLLRGDDPQPGVQLLLRRRRRPERHRHATGSSATWA